jgi:hypothetical protein
MAVVALAALAIAACETLIGAEFDDVRRRSQSAAACDAAVPPDPPDVQQTPGNQEILALITTVDYGEVPGTKGYETIGYDLDGVCTNRGDDPVCMPPAWTGGDPTDGPQGQDNAIGKILSLQEEVFGIQAITSADESALMQQGKRAPFALLRITGFTGFSDDEKVRVEWYYSLPFERSAGATPPKLDGTDAWPVAAFVDEADAGVGDAATTAPPTVAVDDNAYVTESVLVARFPTLRTPLASVYFDVRDVVLTGRLVPDPATSSRRLAEGIVAGHTRRDHMLVVVPRVTYSVFKVPLCTDNANYLEVRKYVCSAADMPLGGVLRPDKVCDGASFAVAFQTHKAQIGQTFEVPPPVQFCPPGTESDTDTCELPEPAP